MTGDLIIQETQSKVSRDTDEWREAEKYRLKIEAARKNAGEFGTHLKDALKKGSKLKLQKPEVSINDVAVLQYTGGTTGISKGAQLSHGNIVSHNSMITAWFRQR